MGSYLQESALSRTCLETPTVQKSIESSQESPRSERWKIGEARVQSEC